ncbi:endoglucanase 16-like [Arachis duranensis]|uniref:cellulase n=1 Tax=Arachis duranensis TaxID=130453 RepID=A0A9C6WL65_ARADU|nr:endoglucanase 16-like [Arachis duranensis]
MHVTDNYCVEFGDIDLSEFQEENQGDDGDRNDNDRDDGADIKREAGSQEGTSKLLEQMLFVFLKSHKGTYDGECPFYCSYSGYNDELMWAATWLYMATRKPAYLKYIQEESISASVTEFNWDLKYAGAQILLTKVN